MVGRVIFVGVGVTSVRSSLYIRGGAVSLLRVVSGARMGWYYKGGSDGPGMPRVGVKDGEEMQGTRWKEDKKRSDG